MTYKSLKEAQLSCDPDHVITHNDLKALEKHIDTVWQKLGLDLAFTKHFLDRVNDPRNDKQITLCELARIFLETFRQYGAKLSKVNRDRWEAVLSDTKTLVNVPFVLKHNGKEVEIVAKTVMRKQNFHTPDPKLVVAGDVPMKKLKEWIGLGDPQVAPVAGPFAVDDVSTNITQIEDPEIIGMLNGFLMSLCDKPFINPYYPVQQAAIKLSTVGLTVPLRGLDLGGDSGVVFIPVTHLGGRFGMADDGSWINDDGVIGKLPGGLSLKVEYSQINGVYTVGMSLVSGEDFGVGVVESKLKEDAKIGDYPVSAWDKEQDGESLFDHCGCEEGDQIDEAAIASGSTATYNGKKYKVLWSGKTKYGERTRLQFFDGSKDFWVDSNLVQFGGSSNSSSYGSNKYDSGMVKCRFCGKRTPDGDDWCLNCGRAGYEY